MIDKYKSKSKTLIRKLADAMPFKKYLTSLMLPVVLTLIFAMTSLFIARDAVSTLAFSAIFLFITLLLQFFMLTSVFHFRLYEFITGTKYIHQEIKALGSYILGQFMVGRLSEGTLQPGDNLRIMLVQLGEATGYPLEQNSYDILLSNLTSKKTTKLLAIWNFNVMPIKHVYEEDGTPIPKETYFDKLSSAYTSIENKEDKQRVFVFKNEADKQEVMSHKGWATLCQFHKENNCPMFGCFEHDLQNVRSHDGLGEGTLDDDFVYYAFKYGQPCVIGTKRKENSESPRKVSLLSGKTCDRTLELYRRLVQRSEPFPQRDV